MAKVPRHILIPYLKQISLAEIACHDQEKEIGNKRNEIQKLEEIPYPNQVSERLEGYWCRRYNLFGVLGCVFGVPAGLMAICLMLYPVIYGWTPWISRTFGIYLELDCFNDIVNMVLIGGVSFLLYGFCISRVQEAERYFSELEAQRHQQRKWERTQGRIAVLYAELEELKVGLDYLEQKRAGLYSRDIIPKPYRSMYPVVYLYDYFSGCNEDDITPVLATFVLEKVCRRLDKVIEELRFLSQHLI